MTAVIRPTWTPDDEEQRKALADAVRLARRARQAEAAKWTAMLRARILGVPDEQLCEQAEESRATLNRRFGPRSRMAVMWTGDNFDEIQALRPDARLTDDGDLLLDHADGTGPVVVGINYVVHRREHP